jgi:hypothetical protein
MDRFLSGMDRFLSGMDRFLSGMDRFLSGKQSIPHTNNPSALVPYNTAANHGRKPFSNGRNRVFAKNPVS